MLIDWFTVVAQALNFLILIWLLKRFLYRPILHAIDEREKRIAARLADAGAKAADAQKEQAEFQRRNEEFDRQRAALLSQATEEAKAERLRLMEEVRTAADRLGERRQESLRTEAENLNHAIIRRAQQEVFAIARKALADLATVSLEEQIARVFIAQIRALDGNTRDILARSIDAASTPVIVRSAFDLPAASRAAIEEALGQVLSTATPIRFDIEPELISGIEMIAGGQKVAWSIADYLATLEKGISEMLSQPAVPTAELEIDSETKPVPKCP